MLSRLRRLWFAARKIRLGVPRSALVLEIGSGDSPCPRSDVLFDLSLEGNERVGGMTVRDRPLVLGDAERLPFRDGAFDYVVAFHVLEHSRNPEAFLSELQRVARAGYLETPSYWAERVQPLTMHRLEVGLEQNDGKPRLVIRKKAAPVPDLVLAGQFRLLLEQPLGWGRLDPGAWVTRYWWKGSIEFRIENPLEPARWEIPLCDREMKNENPRSLPRRLGALWLRRVLGRGRPVELSKLVRCPDCAGNLSSGPAESWSCTRCRSEFSCVDGIPRLFPSPKPNQRAL